MPSSESTAITSPTSFELELHTQHDVSPGSMTWGQGHATQQPEEIGPESLNLQRNVAYSSTFWRQGKKIQLQETEEEYSYVIIS